MSERVTVHGYRCVVELRGAAEAHRGLVQPGPQRAEADAIFWSMCNRARGAGQRHVERASEVVPLAIARARGFTV